MGCGGLGNFASVLGQSRTGALLHQKHPTTLIDAPIVQGKECITK